MNASVVNLRNEPRLRDALHFAHEHNNTVLIDRRTRWGNPFKLGVESDRDTVIARYRRELWRRIEADEIALADLAALSGKTLPEAAMQPTTSSRTSSPATGQTKPVPAPPPSALTRPTNGRPSTDRSTTSSSAPTSRRNDARSSSNSTRTTATGASSRSGPRNRNPKTNPFASPTASARAGHLRVLYR